MNDFFDNAASVYETISYYSQLYSYYGGFNIYLPEILVPAINDVLLKGINSMFNASNGLILDLACGTGMFTRGIAYNASKVYGADISFMMLNKALEYSKFFNLDNISFLRARAEVLPFRENIFDGVSCCGALHLFSDVNKVLVEINRVLKRRGKLAVMTYLKNESLGIEYLNEFKRKNDNYFFEVDELENIIKKNGFNKFKYKIYGSIILFEAKKI
ncbi:class I SAM-dependent methyltransferase [Methanobacterium oryzae]|uniref:class I SAM-dependent methyltransferase n=1 Tax=Methanobacterium oryzae TaxID=69540 RepID=UPI003D1F3096